MPTVITRFAPSPTGSLHIGSARTALFNYLFARHHKGKFLLRIEDTDSMRSTKQSLNAIIHSLQFLDINWDDEIIFQSLRYDLYKNVAAKLIEIGKAYYCFESKSALEIQKLSSINNNTSFFFRSPWRDIPPSLYPKDVAPVIRLKNEHSGMLTFHDIVQGKINIDRSQLDDMVLLRSDGSPTYMFASVVDDHYMGITHIIRGDDHLTNAGRQIPIYEALDWTIPQMVHIPLIHTANGDKLSKRHSATGIEEYRNMGYLSTTINNYLLRLGWSHGNDEIISRENAIAWFDLNNLGKSAARLDFNKLNHLNAYYIKNTEDEKLIRLIIDHDHSMTQHLVLINKIISSIKTRAKTIVEAIYIITLYTPEYQASYTDESIEKFESYNHNFIDVICNLLSQKQQLDIEQLIVKYNVTKHDLMTLIRIIITGRLNTPNILEMINILDNHTISLRVKNFLFHYNKNHDKNRQSI